MHVTPVTAGPSTPANREESTRPGAFAALVEGISSSVTDPGEARVPRSSTEGETRGSGETRGGTRARGEIRGEGETRGDGETRGNVYHRRGETRDTGSAGTGESRGPGDKDATNTLPEVEGPGGDTHPPKAGDLAVDGSATSGLALWSLKPTFDARAASMLGLQTLLEMQSVQKT